MKSETEITVTGQRDSEFVLVPRVPTKKMLKDGWYEALAENAAGVWEAMIAAWEKEKLDCESASET